MPVDANRRLPAPRKMTSRLALPLLALLACVLALSACQTTSLRSSRNPIDPANRPTTVSGYTNGSLPTSQLDVISSTCTMYRAAVGSYLAMVAAAKADGVTRWNIGDSVCALTPGGGYAEYCAAPASHCLPIPKGMSLLEAAALPENYFTVWTNVFERGALKSGETILVHGGSSGIGITAIALAKAFGAIVYTTVGNDDKIAAVKKLGRV